MNFKQWCDDAIYNLLLFSIVYPTFVWFFLIAVHVMWVKTDINVRQSYFCSTMLVLILMILEFEIRFQPICTDDARAQVHQVLCIGNLCVVRENDGTLSRGIASTVWPIGFTISVLMRYALFHLLTLHFLSLPDIDVMMEV